MPLDILVGLQYGDEGKGKVVDSIAENYNIVVRFNGGNNAGHTVQFDGGKLKLHSIPSGIAHDSVQNIIGKGCVVNPSELCAEIQRVQMTLGRTIEPRHLVISKDCAVITPEFIADDINKSQTLIGTTGRGIGPTYSAKHARTATKLQDVIFNYPMLEPYLADTDQIIWTALEVNKDILAEGAQGTWLDIDHGQYPYVTSCNTLASHACTILGVGINYVRDIFGVFKAYTTRVGEGYLENEWDRSLDQYSNIFNNEVGTTTGRSRRCGPLNLFDLNRAIKMNGVTKLIMTKSDLLNNTSFEVIEDIIYCKHLESWSSCSELDENFARFIDYIVDNVGCDIFAVSDGPLRSDYSFNRLFNRSMVK